MICVDTSVWVAAFRNRAGHDARHLNDLLDADEAAMPVPVRIELLSGASSAVRQRLRLTLSALPLLRPEQSTWARIDEWVDRAGDAGERFGFADLLIASIAADHGATIWSKDQDFERMERLGLISRHGPTAGRSAGTGRGSGG